MAKKSKPAKKAPKTKKVTRKKTTSKKSSSKKPVERRMIMTKTIHAKEIRAPEEKPLSESAVSNFRDILMEKRDELLEVVQHKKETEMQIEEPEIGDEADIATRSVEKEMLFELTDSEKQTLDSIEAALRKMEKGVYGRCESCQRVIPKLRLEVMPWARYCIQCQSKNEVPSE